MHLSSAIDPEEIEMLGALWPDAVVERASLAVCDPFLTDKNQLLTSRGRRAEICYVMHRGDPQDGLLLHIKTFYPDDAYRLPTGGIQTGETVLDTLAREIFEETGLTVGEGDENVRVQRLIGVLEYELHHAVLGVTPFATYHFLVKMPPNARLEPQDAEESIGGWQWRPAREMNDVAEILDRVYLQSADWADWGHFRALSHRFVAERIGSA